MYLLLCSGDLLQLSSASVDGSLSTHIALGHPGVAGVRMSASDAPSGCSGITLRVREDVDKPVSSAAALPAGGSIRVVQLACSEREDCEAWYGLECVRVSCVLACAMLLCGARL